jgi:hypothetical protein
MKVVVALLRILNLNGNVYFVYCNSIEESTSEANRRSSISVGLGGPLDLPKLTINYHQINSLRTLRPSHPHIFKPSHPHILTASHPPILKPSHPHILTPSQPHILKPSDPHTLTSSHPHTLTASHSHILKPSDPHTLTPSRPHTLTATHPHSLTPSRPHTSVRNMLILTYHICLVLPTTPVHLGLCTEFWMNFLFLPCVHLAPPITSTAIRLTEHYLKKFIHWRSFYIFFRLLMPPSL